MRANLLAEANDGEGVTGWATFIGEGAPRFILVYFPEQPNPEYAIMLLNTTSREVIEQLVPRVEEFCGRNFPDLKATVRPLDVGPPAWPPIQVRISGRNEDRLFDIVDAVKAKLYEISGTKLIDDDWGARSEEADGAREPAARTRAGVTSQDVAISLQTFLSGLEATDFREDDKLIPITLRSVAAERQDIGKLESLNVYAQSTGESVPLTQVAELEVAWQPSKIKRYDRLKTVTVEAALLPGVTATEINAQLRPWLDEQKSRWGLGYSWEFGGEAESSGRVQPVDQRQAALRRSDHRVAAGRPVQLDPQADDHPADDPAQHDRRRLRSDRRPFLLRLHDAVGGSSRSPGS